MTTTRNESDIDLVNEKKPIQFQIVDIVSSPFEPCSAQSTDDNKQFKYNIQIFGVMANGTSVFVKIIGYYPSFYLKLPYHFTDVQMNGFKKEISVQKDDDGQIVKRRIFRSIDQMECEDLNGFKNGEPQHFVKISSNFGIKTLANQFKNGQVVKTLTECFDSNIDDIIKMLIMKNLTGSGWCQVENYHIPNIKTSSCAFECVAMIDDIQQTQDMSEQIAPLVVCSWDIECIRGDGSGKFPSPESDLDPIIQIGCVFWKFGENKEPFRKCILTLNTCDPIEGVDVISSFDERTLLFRFRDLIYEMDPDIMLGYNSDQFDFQYVMTRAKRLGIQEHMSLGKLIYEKPNITEKVFQSKAYGRSKNYIVTTTGRVQLDLLTYIRREMKLSSYKLNNVAKIILGSMKEDLHYSKILGCFQNNSSTRKQIATYCIQDCMLPLQIMIKKQILVALIQMSRVTIVPLMYLMRRGQQIKVLSQIYKACYKRNIRIPDWTKSTTDEDMKMVIGDEYGDGGIEYVVDDKKRYEGATVLEPQVGLYIDDPIACCDFNSLYPNIMQAHNMCYSTLILDEKYLHIQGIVVKEVAMMDGRIHRFVQNVPSILPEILRDLIKERKSAKKEMEKYPENSAMYSIYNSKQLAVKISANSVYGFTGVEFGMLPCMPIAESVTATGREMILNTKKAMENKFGANCVVYGDTGKY